MLEDEAVRARRMKTAVLIIAIEDHVWREEDDLPEVIKKPVDTKKSR